MRSWELGGLQYLVLLALLVLATVLEGLGADLLVVLLERGKVLTGLGELPSSMPSPTYQ